MENMLQLEKHRKWSQSLGEEERRSNSLATGGLGQGPLVAWTGADRMEPTSETESNHSAESRESGKSRDTSPSHSPVVSIKQFPHPQYSSEEAEVEEQGQGGISKRHLSKAANSHKFRKIQKPSKCR